jgi:hypothetical protein
LAGFVFQHILERTFGYVFHFQHSFFSLKLTYTFCDQAISSSGLRRCHGPCLLTARECHSLHLQQFWPYADWGNVRHFRRQLLPFSCELCVSQVQLWMPARKLVIILLSSSFVSIIKCLRSMHVFGRVVC